MAALEQMGLAALAGRQVPTLSGGERQHLSIAALLVQQPRLYLLDEPACADPDLIQRDISANMRRSVEACLEVGRGLAVLKQACEHGQFMAQLDVLGIDHSVAKRFMQAAVKFSNGATSHHLISAIGFRLGTPRGA